MTASLARPASLAGLRSDLPRDLVRVVAAALARSPGDRPPTAAAFRDAC